MKWYTLWKHPEGWEGFTPGVTESLYNLLDMDIVCYSPTGEGDAPMDTITVKVRRLPTAEGLPLPRYMTEGAAGMDLVAAVEQDVVLRPRTKANTYRYSGGFTGWL